MSELICRYQFWFASISSLDGTSAVFVILEWTLARVVHMRICARLSPTMAAVCFAFIVTGHVQHVFFRKYTQKAAIKYDVKGWVMNKEDGTVVGVASGEPEQLKKFEAFLHKGSPHAVVKSVSWTPMPGCQNFTDF